MLRRAAQVRLWNEETRDQKTGGECHRGECHPESGFDARESWSLHEREIKKPRAHRYQQKKARHEYDGRVPVLPARIEVAREANRERSRERAELGAESNRAESSTYHAEDAHEEDPRGVARRCPDNDHGGERQDDQGGRDGPSGRRQDFIGERSPEGRGPT